MAQLSSSLSITPGCTFCCYLSRTPRGGADRSPSETPPLSSLSVCPVRSLLLPLLLASSLQEQHRRLLLPIGQTYLPTYLPNHSLPASTHGLGAAAAALLGCWRGGCGSCEAGAGLAGEALQVLLPAVAHAPGDGPSEGGLLLRRLGHDDLQRRDAAGQEPLRAEGLIEATHIPDNTTRWTARHTDKPARQPTREGRSEARKQAARGVVVRACRMRNHMYAASSSVVECSMGSSAQSPCTTHQTRQLSG